MAQQTELRPLQPGDRVALISTSIPPSDDLIEESLAILHAWGLKPVFGEHARDHHPSAEYLAGEDTDRAHDLTQAWLDDSIDAIFCLRGGYGSLRLLEHLDRETLQRGTPKPLIGSSDVTGIHEYWLRELGQPSWFAPMFATFDLLRSEHNVERLHEGIFSPISGRRIASSDTTAVVEGTGEGILTGGTLSLLRQSRGMGIYGSGPGNSKGHIVLLEDVAEEPWRLDGQLLTMVRSGYFDGAVGVGLGTWEKCGDPEQVRNVLEHYLKPLGVPLVSGLPFGHGKAVEPVPLGVRAKIHANADDPHIEIL